MEDIFDTIERDINELNAKLPNVKEEDDLTDEEQENNKDDDDDGDDKSDMPPPPSRATSQTTVSALALATPARLPKSSAPLANPTMDNSVRRLRVNDVHVELAPSVITQAASTTSSVAPLTLDHYDVARRLAADQRAEELSEANGASGAASSKIGDTAAQVNHFLIAISEVRSRVDPAILSQLPYATQTNGAHIGRAFYMQALTTAPHLSRPVSEQSDLLRKLASEAKCVRREHIEAMTRTPRLREEVCVNGENCVAMTFCDYYNRPLPERRPLVAFLFEDEWAQARVARQTIAATWKQRACVQCMTRAGNRLVTNLRCKNQAIDARLYLAVPFYVEVDVAGQYPIGATLGPGKRVFESLVFNLPRFSELGWMATTRADATAAANGSTVDTQDVTHFVNISIPPFPVPQDVIQAHTVRGFSAAL